MKIVDQQTAGQFITMEVVTASFAKQQLLVRVMKAQTAVKNLKTNL